MVLSSNLERGYGVKTIDAPMGTHRARYVANPFYFAFAKAFLRDHVDENDYDRKRTFEVASMYRQPPLCWSLWFDSLQYQPEGSYPKDTFQLFTSDEGIRVPYRNGFMPRSLRAGLIAAVHDRRLHVCHADTVHIHVLCRVHSLTRLRCT